MMACVLCLETKLDNDFSIGIFSEEGVALGIKNIISKHFWIEVKDEDFNQRICFQCWNCVLEFHQFYLRIEVAHRALQQTSPEDIKDVKLIGTEQTFDETMGIEVESTQEQSSSQEIEEPKSKRKSRGRAKFSKELNATESLSIDSDSNINDILKIEIDTAETSQDVVPKKKRGRPPSLKKLLIKTKKRSKIYSDEVQIGIMKGRKKYKHTDEEILREEKKKMYAQRKSLSLGFDKFIAENFKLSCCLCELPMDDFSQLEIHFRDEHETHGYVVCCGKKLFKRGVLVDHIKTHQDPEYFKCKECGKVMADRGCLENHMKNRHAKANHIFECEECSKTFFRRDVYIRHIQSHMPEELKKIKCPECSKGFATNCLMTQHLKFVHLDAYSKVCDICGKKIVGKEALERHQLLHDTVPPPPIQCDLCGMTLTSKYGLTRHMKVKHTDEYQTPQACPYCSKVSKNLFAQKRHIYYMHNVERRHACPMCEKAFKTSKVLKEHMTTHTGDVLYTCPYCPTTFNYRSNMYAHRKRAHRQEWEQRLASKNSFDKNDKKIENSIPTNDGQEPVF